MREFLINTLVDNSQHRANEMAFAFPSISSGDRVFTWKETWEVLIGQASQLKIQGIQPGDVILILSDDPKQQAFTFISALITGAVPSIVSHPSIKQDETKFLTQFIQIAQHSNAKAILVSDRYQYLHQMLSSQTRIISLSALESPKKHIKELDFQFLRDTPLFLQYSSGTTGSRKAILVTDQMFSSNLKGHTQAIRLNADDRTISWVPLYHDLGLLGSLLFPLFSNSASVHLSPFEWLMNPVILFETIQRFSGTLLSQPNFAYAYLAEKITHHHSPLNLKSIRAFISAGEPIRKKTLDSFINQFSELGASSSKIHALYGMAENVITATHSELNHPLHVDTVDSDLLARESIALPVSTPLTSDHKRKTIDIIGCGRPILGTEVRISGKSSDRVVGEIQIRGNSCFNQYLGRTSQGIFTDDQWYKTGDLGYIYNGELFVTGRANDLIIVRGRNVYSTDIEFIADQVKGIKPGRAVAFGIDNSGTGTQEVVLMAETLKDEDGAALKNEITRKVQEELSISLTDVVLCSPNSIIKSTSGKLSRKKNRELYLEGIEKRKQNTLHAVLDLSRQILSPFVNETNCTVLFESDCLSLQVGLKNITPEEIHEINTRFHRLSSLVQITQSIELSKLIITEHLATSKPLSTKYGLPASARLELAKNLRIKESSRKQQDSTYELINTELEQPRSIVLSKYQFSTLMTVFSKPSDPFQFAYLRSRTRKELSKQLSYIKQLFKCKILVEAKELGIKSDSNLFDLKTIISPGSTDLVLIFLGAVEDHLFQNDHQSVTRSLISELQIEDRNLILIHDNTYRYFHRGISMKLNSIDSLIHHLGGHISPIQPRRLYCLGLSGGGPAALLVGQSLAAEKTVALSPQIPVNHPFLKRIQRELKKRSGYQSTEIYFSRENAKDKKVADQFARYKNITLHPIAGNVHEVWHTLMDQNQAGSLFPRGIYRQRLNTKFNPEIETVILDFITYKSRSNRKNFKTSLTLNESLDSIGMVELFTLTESLTGQELSFSDLEKHQVKTIEDYLQLVKRHKI